MATKLPGTDVVVIGLGAAGGVAVLPLAAGRARRSIGLEAGTWLTRRDFAPDELRNNFRGWPHGGRRRPIAKCRRTGRMRRRPTTRAAAIHPMMNGVGGTTLHYWAQSWRLEPVGLQGRQRDDAALRRVADPAGLDGRGLAVRLRRARAVLRQGRVRARRVGPGRQRQRRRSIRAATSSKAPRERAYPMPPLRGTGFTELMAAPARALGWHPFPGPAAINSRARTRTAARACITASATAAAATSTRRTRRP